MTLIGGSAAGYVGCGNTAWIPACAGMTLGEDAQRLCLTAIKWIPAFARMTNPVLRHFRAGEDSSGLEHSPRKSAETLEPVIPAQAGIQADS